MTYGLKIIGNDNGGDFIVADTTLDLINYRVVQAGRAHSFTLTSGYDFIFVKNPSAPNDQPWSPVSVTTPNGNTGTVDEPYAYYCTISGSDVTFYGRGLTFVLPEPDNDPFGDGQGGIGQAEVADADFNAELDYFVVRSVSGIESANDLRDEDYGIKIVTAGGTTAFDSRALITDKVFSIEDVLEPDDYTQQGNPVITHASNRYVNIEWSSKLPTSTLFYGITLEDQQSLYIDSTLAANGGSVNYWRNPVALFAAHLGAGSGGANVQEPSTATGGTINFSSITSTTEGTNISFDVATDESGDYHVNVYRLSGSDGAATKDFTTSTYTFSGTSSTITLSSYDVTSTSNVTQTYMRDSVQGYSRDVASTFSRGFAGEYTRDFVRDFVGLYTRTSGYARAFAGTYTRTSGFTRTFYYAGNYIGDYARTSIRTRTSTGASTGPLSFEGNYSGNYTSISSVVRAAQETYSRNFTRTSAYAGNYTTTFDYTRTRISIVEGVDGPEWSEYTGNYAGTLRFIGNYTRTRVSAYSGNYTRISTISPNYTRNSTVTSTLSRTSSYAGTYGRTRTSTYSRTSTISPEYTRTSVITSTRTRYSSYAGTYSRTRVSSYVTDRTQNRSSSYNRTRVSSFAGNYGRNVSYAGNYSRNFAGNYTRTVGYAREYTRVDVVGYMREADYSADYVGNYSRNATYSRNFTRTRASTFAGNYGRTLSYVGDFTGNFASGVSYVGDYTRTRQSTYSRTVTGSDPWEFSVTNGVATYAWRVVEQFNGDDGDPFNSGGSGSSSSTYHIELKWNGVQVYYSSDYGSFANADAEDGPILASNGKYYWRGDLINNFAFVKDYEVAETTTLNAPSSSTTENYTRNFAGNYTRTRAEGDTTRTSVGTFSRTSTYTRTTSGSFVGNYARSYSQTYAGNYTGNYVGTAIDYTTDGEGQPVIHISYVRSFIGNYARNFTRTVSYLRTRVSAYTRSRPATIDYTRTRISSFAGNYTRSFLGNYAGNFSRSFAGEYSGTYARQFAGNYVGNYTGNYTRGIGYVGNYSRDFAGNYSGVYSRDFIGNYVGDYIGEYTRGITYVGDYAGTRDGNVVDTYSRTRLAEYTRSRSSELSFTGDFVRDVSYTRYFTGNYEGVYTRTRASTAYYTASYLGNYVGEYTRNSVIPVGSTRVSSYGNTLSFDGAYSRDFTRTIESTRTSVITRTSAYTRTRGTDYAGTRSSEFIGTYIGNYTRNVSVSTGSSEIGWQGEGFEVVLREGTSSTAVNSPRGSLNELDTETFVLYDNDSGTFLTTKHIVVSPTATTHTVQLGFFTEGNQDVSARVYRDGNIIANNITLVNNTNPSITVNEVPPENTSYSYSLQVFNGNDWILGGLYTVRKGTESNYTPEPAPAPEPEPPQTYTTTYTGNIAV